MFYVSSKQAHSEQLLFLLTFQNVAIQTHLLFLLFRTVTDVQIHKSQYSTEYFHNLHTSANRKQPVWTLCSDIIPLPRLQLYCFDDHSLGQVGHMGPSNNTVSLIIAQATSLHSTPPCHPQREIILDSSNMHT